MQVTKIKINVKLMARWYTFFFVLLRIIVCTLNNRRSQMSEDVRDFERWLIDFKFFWIVYVIEVFAFSNEKVSKRLNVFCQKNQFGLKSDVNLI